MTKTTAGLFAVAAVLALSGCMRDPYLYPTYYQPAPPPLQPYVEPLVAPAPAPARKAAKHRHYRKRHYRPVRCPCR